MKLSQIFYTRSVLSLLVFCLGSLGSQQAVAQCVSGSGATPAELSSQVWPRNFNPISFKSFTVVKIVAGQQISTTTQFQNVTSLTTDGQGLVYVLDAGANMIYAFYGINGSDPVPIKTIQLDRQYKPGFNGQPGTTVNAIFYAGNTLWAALSNHSLAYLQIDNMYDPGNGNSTLNGQGLYPVFTIGKSNFDVTGATFDGQFVYFTTQQATLYQVQPPKGAVVAQGFTYSPPVVQNSLLLGGYLTPPIFDGTSVWTTSGNNLLSIDPQNLAEAQYNLGDVLSNAVFDGTFLWTAKQSSAAIIKFDPLTHRVASTLPTRYFGNLTLSGSAVTVSSGSGAARLRSCDGFPLGSGGGNVLSVTFDGTRTWMVSGSGIYIW